MLFYIQLMPIHAYKNKHRRITYIHNIDMGIKVVCPRKSNRIHQLNKTSKQNNKKKKQRDLKCERVRAESVALSLCMCVCVCVASSDTSEETFFYFLFDLFFVVVFLLHHHLWLQTQLDAIRLSRSSPFRYWYRKEWGVLRASKTTNGFCIAKTFDEYLYPH